MVRYQWKWAEGSIKIKYSVGSVPKRGKHVPKRKRCGKVAEAWEKGRNRCGNTVVGRKWQKDVERVWSVWEKYRKWSRSQWEGRVTCRCCHSMWQPFTECWPLIVTNSFEFRIPLTSQCHQFDLMVSTSLSSSHSAFHCQTSRPLPQPSDCHCTWHIIIQPRHDTWWIYSCLGLNTIYVCC